MCTELVRHIRDENPSHKYLHLRKHTGVQIQQHMNYITNCICHVFSFSFLLPSSDRTRQLVVNDFRSKVQYTKAIHLTLNTQYLGWGRWRNEQTNFLLHLPIMWVTHFWEGFNWNLWDTFKKWFEGSANYFKTNVV